MRLLASEQPTLSLSPPGRLLLRLGHLRVKPPVQQRLGRELLAQGRLFLIRLPSRDFLGAKGLYPLLVGLGFGGAGLVSFGLHWPRQSNQSNFFNQQGLQLDLLITEKIISGIQGRNNFDQQGCFLRQSTLLWLQPQVCKFTGFKFLLNLQS